MVGLAYSNTFKKEARLLSKGDYEQVFSHVGQRVSAKEFIILARANEKQRARLGLIVAKRHVNKAKDRNKIKRYIRETFRLKQNIVGAQDFVVLAKKEALRLTRSEIYECLIKLWNQAGRKFHSTKVWKIKRNERFERKKGENAV